MADAKYLSVVHGCLDNLPTLNSRLVRIFISSTFTDTQEERNLLLEEVYPKLKSYCKEKYGMDFQLVDMRWGVPLDAADDHLATELCLEEIRNCQKLSTGPNFVTFLNQKHGYRPLQVSIPDTEFCHLTSCLKEKNKNLFQIERWYLKDENQVPPVYVLQPISSLLSGYKDKDNFSAKQEWQDIFQSIREDLKFASKLGYEKQLLTEEEKHKYFMSVTEDEIFNGILKLPENAGDHCLCFVRIIEDITSHLDHNKAWRFIDVVTQDNGKLIDEESQLILRKLRDEKIVTKLQDFNITRNMVKWSEKDGINRLDHEDYLQVFRESFYTSIVALVDKAVKKEKSLTQDDLYIEVLQHANMAVERCAVFHGREEILDAIGSYLQDKKPVPLILFGQSGCGKTSIMAQTAKMVPNTSQNAAVILRFLGTSPDSSNLWRLLYSLCEQIVICYGGDKKKIPEDFDELKDYFLEVLKLATVKKPLVVLLDSLDQLSREHNSYKLNWLPRKLPSNVKLIVSTYTEALDLIGTLRIIYLSSNFIMVPVFSTELSSQVLKSWLKKKCRTLTTDQLSSVEEAFEQCSLPLFVKLIFDQVLTWKSYTPLSKDSLTYTVQQSIDKLFSQLEKKHGSVFVSRALAYVTASKTGISETELEDLLSLDDTVLTSVFQIHVPPLRRIPPLLWVRIRHDVSQYLVDKEVDEVRSFFWYHRQFFETAEKRYLSDNEFKKEIHSLMADYYIGIWHGVPKPFKYTQAQMKRVGVTSPDGEADRKISSQPLIFTKAEDEKKVRYNKRKLSKLPYHLYEAGRQKDLRSMCLLNYDWIQAKLRALSVQEMLLDYTMFGEKESVLHKAFKAAQSTLKKFPQTLAMEISGRLLALLQTKAGPDEIKLIEESLKASEKQCRLVPHQPCYNIPSEAHLYTLEHPRIPVNSKMADISNDSAHLAILSTENEILIWDLVSGEMEATTKLTNEQDITFNIMLKPPGKDILIIGTTLQQKSNPVVMVDINNGAIEKELKLDKQYTKIGFVSDLEFSVTEKHLLVLARRQAADVFDKNSGKIVHEFDGEPDQMCLIADDTLIICHPKQTNIYTIYDMNNFEFVYQISCTETPQALFVSPTHDTGCIVMNQSPVVQMVSLKADDKLGQIIGKLDLTNFLRSKIQCVQIQSNLCLITTIDGFILWDINSNKKKHIFEIPDNLKPNHRVLEFQGVVTHDLTTVVAAYEKHFITWDVKSGRLVHTTEATRGRVSKMMLSPFNDHIIIISKRNNNITTWKLSSLKTKMSDYRPLSMNDSARYISVNEAGTAAVVRSMTSTEFAVIDIALGTKRCEISKDYEAMNPYVTEDGKYAVLREYNSDNCLKIWDTNKGHLVTSLPVSSLNLKGYVLGTRAENMALLLEDDRTGNHELQFCNVPSGKSSLSVELQKYNMMQIFFAKDDKFCLVGIEEQLHPGIRIYAKSFHVGNGSLVKEYEKMHPKFIQRITRENDCFVGQHIYTDENGKESWEMVVLNIETGETMASCRDPPQSTLCFGLLGRHGIDKERNIYDVKKGVKCFQFDSESEYNEILPSRRTSPKVTSDEKFAVWLQLSTNLLKVGEISSQTIISVCPIHSMAMNIEVTPQQIIMIGCEDGRIMMLQLLIGESNSSSVFKNIFNRSARKGLKMKDSMMNTLHAKDIKAAEVNRNNKQEINGTNKNQSSACVIL